MKKHLYFSAALALALCLSCNKNSSSKTSSCQLITITDVFGGTTTTYNLSYNTSGQLASVEATGDTNYSKVLIYNGDQLIATTSDRFGSLITRDSIELNSGGLVMSDRQVDNMGNVTTYTFNPGSNGEPASANIDIEGTPLLYTFTFTDGDLTSLNTGTQNLVYTFNDNKAFMPGDVVYVQQLLEFGAFYYKDTHQVASLEEGTTTQTYNYTYDASGNITTVTAVSGTSTVETLTYTYNCN
jgi:YD repeat-containing protein